MSSQRRAWGVFFLQTTVAFIVLFTANQFFFTYSTVYDGGLQAFTFVGAMFGGPILTNLVCVLVGLPLRIGPASGWWRRRWWIAFIGIALAAALITLSWTILGEATYGVGELGDLRPMYVPSPIPYYVGWFLMSFSITHAWLPRPNPKLATT